MAKRKRKRKVFALPRERLATILRGIRYWSFVFFVFSMPLFLLPGNTEYGYTKSIYTLCFISLLYILWGLEGLSRGKIEAEITQPAALVPAFLLAALVSIAGGAHPLLVLQYATLFLYFGLLYLLVVDLLREDREIIPALVALLSSGFLAGLYGLLQYLGVTVGGPGRGLSALISTMGNRNYLGGFLAYMVLPTLIPWLLRRRWSWALLPLWGFVVAMVLFVRQDGVRLALGAASLLFAFGSGFWGAFRGFGLRELLLLSLPPLGAGAIAAGIVVGPGAVLALVVLLAVGAGLHVLGMLLRRRRVLWIPVGAAALLALFLLLPPVTPLGAVREAWAKNAGRVRAWDWWVGYYMFRDHPLTGVGLGAYKVRFVPYKPEFLSSPHGEAYRFPIARAAQAHNEYVQVAAELGIPGLIVLFGGLGFIAYLWVRRLSAQPDPKKRLELLLLGAGAATTLVHALVSFPWHLPASSLVFVISLGLIFSPRYGRIGSFQLSLKGRALWAAVAAAVVVGIGVSTLGVRDLIADRLFYKGKIALFRGDPATAVSYLRRSVSLDFFPRLNLYWLGLSYRELARKLETEAQGRDDRELLAKAHALKLEAKRLLELSLHRYVPDALYLNLASLELELGETDKAVELLQTLIATKPSRDLETAAHYLLAYIAYHRGETAQAEKELQELLKRDPSYERALILLGDIAAGTARYSQARTYYSRALKVVQRKLSRVEAKLKRPLPPEEFGEARAQKETLERLEKLLREKLSSLPKG